LTKVFEVLHLLLAGGVHCGTIPSERNIIVLYDDKTSDISELQCESNPLKIVQDNIKQSGVKKECKILKGGFQSFIQMFPDMCVIKSDCDNPALKYAAYYHNHAQPCQSAVDNAVMTKIMPHLYLGNECDARNLQALEKEGIYYILNVTKAIPMPPASSKFIAKRIAVNDCPGQNLKQHFEEAFDFIDEAKNNNSKVLVHCQAGVSRSPTIVIAYMMSRLHITMNEAMERVRQQRPIIEPNFVFLNQLKDFEDKLFGNKCSSDEVKITLNNNNSSSNHHHSTSNLLKTLLSSTASFFSHNKDDETTSKDNCSSSSADETTSDERNSISAANSSNSNSNNNDEPLTPTSSPNNVPLLVS
jgi:protein-tyrosine phosphatase